MRVNIVQDVDFATPEQCQLPTISASTKRIWYFCSCYINLINSSSSSIHGALSYCCTWCDTGWFKKASHQIFVITSTLTDFKNFCKKCNKVMLKDSTTPQALGYITLWNINVRKLACHNLGAGVLLRDVLLAAAESVIITLTLRVLETHGLNDWTKTHSTEFSRRLS